MADGCDNPKNKKKIKFEKCCENGLWAAVLARAVKLHFLSKGPKKPNKNQQKNLPETGLYPYIDHALFLNHFMSVLFLGAVRLPALEGVGVTANLTVRKNL